MITIDERLLERIKYQLLSYKGFNKDMADEWDDESTDQAYYKGEIMDIEDIERELYRAEVDS